MTLVRPPRHLTALEPEVATVAELSIEQQILTTVQALDSKVASVERNGNFLRLVLMGDVEGETQHGRMPIAEANIGRLIARVDRLEEQIIRWKAYVAAAAGIGGVTGSIAGVLIAAVVEIMKRR